MKHFIRNLVLGSLILSSASCKPRVDSPPSNLSAEVPADQALLDKLISQSIQLDKEYRDKGRVFNRTEFLNTLLPEMHRRHYTVLHSSEAEEYIDPMDDADVRVVAFGEDAKTIIAWITKSDQVQFAQHRGDHLEMRSIDFPTKLEDPLRVSEPNPPDCAGGGCHGASENPVYKWAPYPSWPKAFAGSNDFVRDQNELDRVNAFYRSWTTQKEPTPFQKLHWIADMPNVSGVFRTSFANPSTLALPPQPGDMPVANRSPKAFDYRYRPNTYLTMALSRLHAKQVYAQMRAAENFTKHLIPFLFVWTRCESSNLTAPQVNKMNAHLENEHRRLNRRGIVPRINDGLETSRWLTWSNFFGVPLDRWDLSDQDTASVAGLPQYHLYRAGFTKIAYLVGALAWEDLVERIPSWQPFFLEGTLRNFEDRYFGDLTYAHPDQLDRQVKTMDELGKYLDVDPASYMPETRTLDHPDRHAATCSNLASALRRDFRLDN